MLTNINGLSKSIFKLLVNNFIKCNFSSTSLQPGTWTQDSKRCGAIGMKIGMIPVWDSWGQRIPCTVVQIDNCQVVQVKTQDKDGFNALQLGTGAVKLSNVGVSELFHFNKYGVEPKRILYEFPVTSDALLPSGTTINAMHFVPGQKIDVTGYSKGKGFQGVVKRWNFAGQNKTHGNTKSTRKGGSYGQRQDPGKIWKGKKMPGRMGNDKVTTLGLELIKIELKRNLLYIKGSIPGNAGGYIKIRDSILHKFNTPPPFPTYIPKEGEVLKEEYFMPLPSEDPFAWYFDSSIDKSDPGVKTEKSGAKSAAKTGDKGAATPGGKGAKAPAAKGGAKGK